MIGASAIAAPLPPASRARPLRILTVLEPQGWSQEHIASALAAMGHEVIRFDQGGHVAKFYGMRERGVRRDRNAQFLDTARECIRSGGLDLIFCYVYDDFLDAGTARALSRLDVPMVNLNVDMANQWYRQIGTAKYFTRMLCAQQANMDNLARHAARVLYFPMASNPHAPDGDNANGTALPAMGDICFVGTPTPFRAQVLAALAKSGLDVAIHGKGWLENQVATPERSFEKTLSDAWHYGPARLSAEGIASAAALIMQRLTPERRAAQVTLPATCLKGFAPQAGLGELFSAAPINIGFTRMTGDLHTRRGLWQIKLRDFEVPLAGGFYLVERAPDHELLFALGTEIETWSSLDELIDKARHYLAHESERRAIAAAGQRRALRDHTWRARFDTLFAELGIGR